MLPHSNVSCVDLALARDLLAEIHLDLADEPVALHQGFGLQFLHDLDRAGDVMNEECAVRVFRGGI